MHDLIFMVTIESELGSDSERWGFTDAVLAAEYAGVRGGCDVEVLAVLDEHDAKRMIADEAKQRRDEERFDRMRDEGEI